MPITAQAQSQIQGHLDEATKASGGAAGLVFCAIDKDGKYLSRTCSGVDSANPAIARPMTLDSVFWIASCTKLITGIACMQLHERGQLDIDSATDLYALCPELRDKRVLTPNGRLESMEGEITVRRLLDHTAGFGYSFFNERLRDHARPAGWDEFAGDEGDYLDMPLVNQPGRRWEYGINIDWAGIAVMRKTGMSLDEYFRKNIFEPLGIENVGFFPSRHMREHLVHAQQHQPDGSLRDIDHPFRRPVAHAERGTTERVFNSGGAGCFAKPAEYCQILATLLNNGTSPETGARILAPETVDAMFANSIPQFPDFARQGIPAAKPEWTHALPQLYPQDGDPPQGWGITFMLTLEPGATGRSAGTAWWAGIANLYYWIDREKGVAGLVAAQKRPFADPAIMGAWANCEAAVYSGLY